MLEKKKKPWYYNSCKELNIMKKSFHVYKNLYWHPMVLVKNLCYLVLFLLVVWPVVSWLDFLFHMKDTAMCAGWNFWLWLIG